VKRWFQEVKNKKQRVRTEADIRAKITTNSGTLEEIAMVTIILKLFQSECIITYHNGLRAQSPFDVLCDLESLRDVS
jgi:hypothetical protein